MTKYLNHEAFDIVTNDAAYWIGFLFADGSVIQQQKGAPQVQLRLSEVDRATLRSSANFWTLHMLLPLVHQEILADINQGPRLVMP
jgi:hypothetical protein